MVQLLWGVQNVQYTVRTGCHARWVSRALSRHSRQSSETGRGVLGGNSAEGTMTIKIVNRIGTPVPARGLVSLTGTLTHLSKSLRPLRNDGLRAKLRAAGAELRISLGLPARPDEG